MESLDTVSIPEVHHCLLQEQPLAMLTTIRADQSLSTNPVGFLFDGERIRISTLKSRIKYKSIERDSRIAFCVVSFRNPTYYVEIRGYATLEDDADRSFLRQTFNAGYGEDPPDDLDPPGAERAIITIHPTRVSAPKMYGGRFDR